MICTISQTYHTDPPHIPRTTTYAEADFAGDCTWDDKHQRCQACDDSYLPVVQAGNLGLFAEEFLELNWVRLERWRRVVVVFAAPAWVPTR